MEKASKNQGEKKPSKNQLYDEDEYGDDFDD